MAAMIPKIALYLGAASGAIAAVWQGLGTVSSVVKPIGAMAAGNAAMVATQAGIMNLDNVVIQALGAPVSPDSLESTLRIVAGVAAPFVGGLLAHSISSDWATRVIAGVEFGGFMGKNLGDGLEAAANDLLGLEAFIRSQGILGLKGIGADAVANVANYAAQPASAVLGFLSQFPKMHVSLLDNVPVVGSLVSHANPGAVLGLFTINHWGIVPIFVGGYLAHQTLEFGKFLVTNKYARTIGLAVAIPLLGKALIGGALAQAGINIPYMPMALDAAALVAYTVIGYRGLESRLGKFAVAASAGLLASGFLDTYFGPYMSQMGNSISSISPALAPVKSWIPGLVGASTGLVAEAYRQSYKAMQKFAIPVKYGLLAGLGYVAASNMAFNNPNASLIAAVALPAAAGLDELLTRTHAHWAFRYGALGAIGLAGAYSIGVGALSAAAAAALPTAAGLVAGGGAAINGLKNFLSGGSHGAPAHPAAPAVATP